MQTSVTLNPSAAFAAFDDWAQMQRIRGKSSEQNLKKVMKFWISFAIFKIQAADPADIEANLMRLTKGHSRRLTGMIGASSNLRSRRVKRASGAAMADKYRGTVAAAIVAYINYKGVKTASSLKSRKAVVVDSAAFYQTVRKFVAARKYSARHHKAGFYPSITALKISASTGGRLPKYRNTPGSYKEDIRDLAATLVAENFASAAPRPGRPAPLGISGLAPDCLTASEPEVARLLADWLAKDLMDAAHGAGFSALSRGPVTTAA